MTRCIAVYELAERIGIPTKDLVSFTVSADRLCVVEARYLIHVDDEDQQPVIKRFAVVELKDPSP